MTVSDTCITQRESRWSETRKKAARKLVSRTIYHGGATSQFFEFQNVCRDCLFVCMMNVSGFTHVMGWEADARSSTSSGRRALKRMLWKNGTE